MEHFSTKLFQEEPFIRKSVNEYRNKYMNISIKLKIELKYLMVFTYLYVNIFGFLSYDFYVNTTVEELVLVFYCRAMQCTSMSVL